MEKSGLSVSPSDGSFTLKGQESPYTSVSTIQDSSQETKLKSPLKGSQMPSLKDHQSNLYTKMLIMGDSGSGKTGAMASLVKAGYKLRILDLDNGLETLKQFVLKECPENIDHVEYRTLRDKRKATSAGSIIDGSPQAFIQALRMLDHWKYDDVDLGPPAGWGPDCILVVDSLSFLSDAAFDFREHLAGGSKGGKYDIRAVYKDGQDAIENVLGLLTGDSFQTNVIVTAHVRYIENPDGTKKGYPNSIGSALSPTIPRYFNSVALCQTKAGGKRTIQTVATSMIDLKNPKPFAMLPSYPLETGLADYFAVLREPPTKEKPESSEPKSKFSIKRPTSISLRRI